MEIVLGTTLLIVFLLGSWAIYRFMPEGGSGMLRHLVIWIMISVLFSGLMWVWNTVRLWQKEPAEERVQTEETFKEQIEKVDQLQGILEDIMKENDG